MNGKKARIKVAVQALLASGELRATWLAALRRAPELARFEACLASPPSWSPTSRELASLVDIGERTFRNRVRRLIGLTPIEAITSLKLARAAGELRRADATVGTIAEREGYVDAAAFAHHFTRYVGACPSLYAAALRPRSKSPRSAEATRWKLGPAYAHGAVADGTASGWM